MANVLQGYVPSPPTGLEGEQIRLQNERLRMENQALPEERNWLREYRGMTAEEHQWRKEQRMREIERRGYTNEKEAVEHLREISPMLNLDSYGKSKTYLEGMGLRKDLLPDEDYFYEQAVKQKKNPYEVFDDWRRNTLPSPKFLESQRLLEMKATAEAQEPASDIGKLQKDRERLSRTYGEGSSIVQAIDTEIQKKSQITESKMDIHFTTDINGQEWKIISDPRTGKEISREPTIQKPSEKEPKPSDFDKKWALSKKIAKESLKRNPTDSEIANVYRRQFGTAGLLELFGITAGPETSSPPSGKPTPKF